MEPLLNKTRIVDKHRIVDNLTEQDLHMHMSLGFVMRSRLGSLINLRAELEGIFKENFTHPELSSTPLYVVHWNDLTDKKKLELGRSKR